MDQEENIRDYIANQLSMALGIPIPLIRSNLPTPAPWNKTGLGDYTVQYLLLYQNIYVEDVEEVTYDETRGMLFVKLKLPAESICFDIFIPKEELGIG